MKGLMSKAGRAGALILFLIIFLMMVTTLACAQEGAYEKALKAYLKKDFKNTVKYLKEHVAAKPDADAYYLLGYASYKLKNRKEAAEYFRQAYLIDPDFSPKEIEFKGIRK